MTVINYIWVTYIMSTNSDAANPTSDCHHSLTESVTDFARTEHIVRRH